MALARKPSHLSFGAVTKGPVWGQTPDGAEMDSRCRF
jgi:hypothetical protein